MGRVDAAGRSRRRRGAVAPTPRGCRADAAGRSRGGRVDAAEWSRGGRVVAAMSPPRSRRADAAAPRYAVVDDRSRDAAIYALLNTDWRRGGARERAAARLEVVVAGGAANEPRAPKKIAL